MKFLVIWKIELSLLSSHVAAAVARMPAYAQPLERSGQIAARYRGDLAARCRHRGHECLAGDTRRADDSPAHLTSPWHVPAHPVLRPPRAVATWAAGTVSREENGPRVRST